jgi:predicted deacetylase
VTVAQHGYTHEDFAEGYEFQAAPDLEQRLASGRVELERALGTRVRIFVPPHNALSKRGLAAVGAQGLNVLGSFLSFRPSMRPWDRQTPANWWRVQRYRRKTRRSRSDRLVYPHVLRYTSHAEFACHSLIPGTSVDELVAGFEEARAAAGHFCLATHYWEVDETLKGVLLRVLEHARRYPDVTFVAAERLFDAA